MKEAKTGLQNIGEVWKLARILFIVMTSVSTDLAKQKNEAAGEV